MAELNLSAMSQADIDALLAQARAVLGDKKSAQKRAYAKDLDAFLRAVIEHEDYATSEKSDWAGFRVAGIPVSVEGHAFTVSVTITDTEAKEQRAKVKKLEEARATLAAAEAEAAAQA